MRWMISIPGSLSFAKLVMMSSAPAKSAGNPRYASQDPFIHCINVVPHKTPICIRSALLLHRTQLICLFTQLIFFFLYSQLPLLRTPSGPRVSVLNSESP